MVSALCLLSSLLLVELCVGFGLRASAGDDDRACGGNCMSDSCDVCICGEKQTPANLSSVCGQSYWSDSCCQCVVRLVSRGNANAVVMSDNRVRVGLFQISSFEWVTCNAGRPPCDPLNNLACAAQIYKRDGSWKKYWGDAASKCGCK